MGRTRSQTEVVKILEKNCLGSDKSGMESLALTISLTELAQLAAMMSGAVSAVIEARWLEEGKEVSERVVFKDALDDSKHEQIFESGNCCIYLRFRNGPKPLDPSQRQGLNLVAGQVIRQVEAKQVSLEQQKKVTQSAKMSALGEMASGIAHEINNPLAIIQGHLSKMRTLIENDVLENDTLMDSVHISSKTVSRLGKIVEGLRKFARDGEGDPFQKVELYQIVNEVLGLCQEKFNNHNIKINIPPISRGIVLECRQIELCQVLLNLLNNSFDAISDRPERWVDLKIADRDNEVEVRVTDSGKIIPVEIRQKIFQPFFTTKMIGKGAGLGLSISKGIIEGHQGSIKLSDGGRNTEFVILLPKAQRAR
jgi:C4-dicarboxylate-specific signal transduction histidine kinase